MSKLLTGGIAKQVYKGLKAAQLTLPATLVKVAPGTRTPGAISAGTNPTKTGYPAAGLVADFDAGEFDGTEIVFGDRKVVLFGASLPSGITPSANDEVTIDGGTYRIKRILNVDPAKATYTCQTHGAATT